MVKNDTKATRTDLSGDAVEEISSNLRRLLADVFALYVKTKNFHWHMSGRHFRGYHLLLQNTRYPRPIAASMHRPMRSPGACAPASSISATSSATLRTSPS